MLLKGKKIENKQCYCIITYYFRTAKALRTMTLDSGLWPLLLIVRIESYSRTRSTEPSV